MSMWEGVCLNKLTTANTILGYSTEVSKKEVGRNAFGKSSYSGSLHVRIIHESSVLDGVIADHDSLLLAEMKLSKTELACLNLGLTRVEDCEEH